MKTPLLLAFLLSILSLQTAATVFYADPQGGNTPPFTTRESAAIELQAAADLAQAGDEILAMPGRYASGGIAITGSLISRITLPEGVTLRSLEGPEKTIIEGIPGNSTNAVRCAYLKRNARLIGFTLTKGGTRGEVQDIYRAQSGGGAFCEEGAELENCILTQNSAYNYGGGAYGGKLLHCVISRNSALRGGGAALAQLTNCLVVQNQASHLGGGAYRSLLEQCTVSRNVSSYGGGGVYECRVSNSIVLDNTARWINPNHAWGLFNRVCTDPLPERGVNNLTDRVEAEMAGLGASAELSSRLPASAQTDTPPREKRQRMDRKKSALGLLEEIAEPTPSAEIPPETPQHKAPREKH